MARLRSLLFVPGDSPAKLRKAAGLPADGVVVDLEDAVGPGNKDAARDTVAEFFRARPRFAGLLLIRLNPRGSAHFAGDCRMAAEAAPDGIVLSKCEGPEDVLEAEELLRREFPLAAMIESARALTRAGEIAGASPRLAALAFGAEDFSADVGITRTEGEPELLYARSALVVAARAAGKPAFDSPCLDFQSEDPVRASARRARNLGFAGKFVIHPMQIEIVNSVFLPTEAEVDEARRILDASARAAGGAAGLDGRMIDEPVVRRARRILALAAHGEAARKPGA